MIIKTITEYYISILRTNIKSQIYTKKSYPLEEIKHNDLISENYKKRWNYLNYIKHLVILVSTITGCALISALASLVYVPVGITNFAIGLKICAITAGVKKYKSIITKKEKEVW